MTRIYSAILALILSFSVSYAQGTGCPEVTASPNQVLPCTQACTQISASAFDVGETNTYTVNPIPHSPPIAYNQAGGTAISVNTDDVWSNVINLPFPFCFFGQTYTQCIVGSNGAINFNTSSAGGYHPWPFSASVPSPNLVQAGNIFGPYHDIDPSVAGSVRWYLLGQAPCRIFVVSYNNLGHYSCTNLRSTHMMVLYETTNVIEVYVERKQTCNSWNSGNTVIGIQNPAGTVGFTPPGRNTGNWTVTTPEAWQFKPAGSPIYSPIQWFEGSNLIGTGDNITVCPTGTSTYTARTTYTRCDGLEIQAQDQVTVSFSPNPTVSLNPVNPFSCSGSNVTLTASSPNNVSYSWSTGAGNVSSINVAPATTTTYTVTATDNSTGCLATASTTVNIAEPTGNSCNVLYVTPTGSPSGDGTRGNPMDLRTALIAGACNGTVVKMSTGDYVTDTTINGITSFLTLEGGFDASVNWEKVSTPGATRILRTATMTTSTLNGTGVVDEAGTNPRVVGIEVNSQTGFRFQDITVEVVSLAGNSPILGYRGVSTKGIEINSSTNYNIVRTNVLVGAASDGSASFCAVPATQGGSSFGIDITGNGAGTNIISSNVTAGAAGTGGAGCLPTFPNGAPGITQAVRIAGTPLVTNESSFNLAGQPVIRMDDIACTSTPIEFRTGVSDNWTFGAGSAPPNATGSTVSSSYNSLGRKTIGYAGNNYVGFANILLDDQIQPEIATTAPFVQGQFRVCAGESVTFTAVNGGVGYVYIWSSGTTTISGSQFSSITVPFDEPGIYNIELRYETSCCGVSVPDVIQLYVEANPQPVVTPDQDICLGATAGVQLTVSGVTTGGSIQWSPATGLNNTSSATVIALPLSTTTYTVQLTDSTGLCSNTANVTVNVIDLILTPSSTSSDCITGGSASVSVAGGSGDYSYEWSNGGNTATIDDLQPGDYSVIVTDNVLGCQDSIVVNVPAGPGALVGNITFDNMTCAGANDGSVTISITGGTAPYTYSWSAIGGTVTTPNTTQTISNLPAGVYEVTIIDNTGCDFVTSATITEPNPIVMIVDSVFNPPCADAPQGFIRIQSDGGQRPYTFSWNNSVPVVEVNDGVNASNLPAGSYTLTLTDDLGCEQSVTVDLLPTIAPTAEIVSVQSICAGETSSIFITGTIGATVVYNINGGPNQNIVINGFGEATIVTGNLTQNSTIQLVSITSIAPELCQATLNESASISVTSLPVANLSANEVCEGESSTVTFTGTPNATVVYNVDGGADQTIVLNAQGQASVNSGALFSNITYNLVSVTSNTTPACETLLSSSVEINVLPLPVVSIDGSTSVCSGTETNVVFTGTPNTQVTYTINGGEELTVVLDQSGNAVVQTGNLTEDVVYELVSVDYVNSDCGQEASGSVVVEVNPLPEPTITATPDTIIRDDNSVIEVTGGVTFEWSPVESDESIITVAPLETTEYTVVLANEFGCEAQISITVYVLPRAVTIALPDAFTPNGDGINDVFEIFNKSDFTSITMRVYNRWGELVHEGRDQNHGWDGTFKGVAQSQDVYVYFIEATSEVTGQSYKVNASFSLVR